jgi:hypothetical protein
VSDAVSSAGARVRLTALPPQLLLLPNARGGGDSGSSASGSSASGSSASGSSASGSSASSSARGAACPALVLVGLDEAPSVGLMGPG